MSDTNTILKAIDAQGERLNKRIDDIEKKSAQPAYNPNQIGLGLGLVGDRDSGGYSILKAAKFATGKIKKDLCKEEIHIHEQLSDLYEELGYTKEYGDNGFLMPFSTEHIPDAGIKRNGRSVDGGKLRHEIRQKMAASVTGFDPQQASALARQSGVPWNMQKAMGTTTDTAGGVLVGFPTLGELIDLQRNLEAFANAGAQETTLPPNGRIQYPKLINGATAYWVGESLIGTESQEKTGNLNLQAKKLGVYVRMNNELLRFTTPSAEGLIRSDMARVAALAADASMLTGTGGTQILGLLNYPTQADKWVFGNDNLVLRTASVVGGNGDSFQVEDPALMESALPDEVEPTAWLMRRSFFASLMNRRADAAAPGDGAGPFMFRGTRWLAGDKPPNELYGTKVVRTSQIANNLTKGSATNLTYTILGRFSDWITARHGIMEFLASGFGTNELLQDQTLLRGLQHIDAGPRHAASFVLCTNLIPNP